MISRVTIRFAKGNGALSFALLFRPMFVYFFVVSELKLIQVFEHCSLKTQILGKNEIKIFDFIFMSIKRLSKNGVT